MEALIQEGYQSTNEYSQHSNLSIRVRINLVYCWNINTRLNR